MKNEMTLVFGAFSPNEAFARNTVAAFCVPLDPTVDELSDIKTAVSEAVTNCIVHAYPNYSDDNKIQIDVALDGQNVHIAVSDTGIGIEDIAAARQPFFSTKSDTERSGMGFTVMESFMDELSVQSSPSGGTVVTMSKAIRGADWKGKKHSN